MDIYYIPFQEHFLVYRPLLLLAFMGDEAMVRYLRNRLEETLQPRDEEVENFLEQIGFWEPDPPTPNVWQPQAEHRPTAGVLLMTSACNLRCTYCYAFGGEGPLSQMDFSVAETVIDTVHENARLLGRDHFTLTFHGGGEPTSNWQVLKQAVACAEAKDLPCQISMSTNGVLSREKRQFVIDHFSNVSLSFDGIRAVQDAQRRSAGGGSSFDVVMKTIGQFDEAGFPYGVRLTVTPQTFSTLPQSVDFLCRQTRCGSIQAEPTYSGERGGHVDPDAEQSAAFIAAFRQAFEVACRHGRTLAYSGARPRTVTDSFCKAASEALVVTPEGSVVTCFEIHDSSHPLSDQFTVGRVKTAESCFTTPSAGSRLLPIIERQADGVEIDLPVLQDYARSQEERRQNCRDCFCYWHCAGDCATRRSAPTSEPQGRCHVNREITKDQLAWYLAAGGGVWRGLDASRPNGSGPGRVLPSTP